MDGNGNKDTGIERNDGQTGQTGDTWREKSARPEFISDLLINLLVLLLTDIGTVIVYFIFVLISNPITGEIAAREGKQTEAAIELIRAGVCVAIYLILTAALAYNNTVDKGRFVNCGKNAGVGYFSELIAYAKRYLPIQALSALIFGLPLYLLVAIFPNIKALPTIFIPLYSLITLTGNVWISYAVFVIGHTLFISVITPLIHVIWDKKRLYKG